MAKSEVVKSFCNISNFSQHKSTDMRPKITLSEMLSMPLLSDTGLPLVDDVLRIMRHNPVFTPQDVATILDVPKRDLSAAIMLLTGQPLNVLMKELRKYQAIDLLNTTDLDGEEIARECGFRSLHNLSLFLDRETGLTAYEWREHCSNRHREPAERAKAYKKIIKLHNEGGFPRRKQPTCINNSTPPTGEPQS